MTRFNAVHADAMVAETHGEFVRWSDLSGVLAVVKAAVNWYESGPQSGELIAELHLLDTLANYRLKFQRVEDILTPPLRAARVCDVLTVTPAKIHRPQGR